MGRARYLKTALLMMAALVCGCTSYQARYDLELAAVERPPEAATAFGEGHTAVDDGVPSFRDEDHAYPSAQRGLQKRHAQGG